VPRGAHDDLGLSKKKKEAPTFAGRSGGRKFGVLVERQNTSRKPKNRTPANSLERIAPSHATMCCVWKATLVNAADLQAVGVGLF
jgi:hypothetical protein